MFSNNATVAKKCMFILICELFFCNFNIRDWVLQFKKFFQEWSTDIALDIYTTILRSTILVKLLRECFGHVQGAHMLISLKLKWRD